MKMMDVTSPKVAVPAVLFALLSPGMLLQLPSKIPGLNANSFATGKTDMMSVFFHALVFMIVYKLVAMQMGVVLKQSDLLVPTLLFVLLSPGLLLTIPGSNGMVNFASGATSIPAVIVHAIVFAVVFALLRSQFPQFY